MNELTQKYRLVWDSNDIIIGDPFTEQIGSTTLVNTTNYFDSHGDVHLKGIWTKSLQEQQGKLYYITDHSFKIGDVIAWPGDVKAYTKDIEWQIVGKGFEGTTQALIYEIAKDKIVNDIAKDVINEKRDIQNSVSMIYVKIDLAVDSSEKDYKKEKAAWDKHINSVANKNDAIENGYMWLVSEAKIYKAGSMVLLGSNDATSIIYEPEKSTQSTKSDKATLEAEKKKVLLTFIKNY